MKYLALSLLTVLLIIYGCRTDHHPHDQINFSQLKEQFMKENRNWSHAARQNDARYIWNLYQEDAWLGIPGKDYLKGKKAIQEQWEKTVPLVDDLGFETLRLSGNEDIIYETGHAFTTYTVNGKTIIDTTKYLIVWELDEDMNYKIGADLFTN